MAAPRRIRRATPSWDTGPWGMTGMSGACEFCGKEIVLSPDRNNYRRFIHADTWYVRCAKETAK